MELVRNDVVMNLVKRWKFSYIFLHLSSRFNLVVAGEGEGVEGVP